MNKMVENLESKTEKIDRDKLIEDCEREKDILLYGREITEEQPIGFRDYLNATGKTIIPIEGDILLSKVIKLNEKMGMPINRELILGTTIIGKYIVLGTLLYTIFS